PIGSESPHLARGSAPGSRFILPEDPGPPPLVISFGSGAAASGGGGVWGGTLIPSGSDPWQPSARVAMKAPSVEKLTIFLMRINRPSLSQGGGETRRRRPCRAVPVQPNCWLAERMKSDETSPEVVLR